MKNEKAITTRQLARISAHPEESKSSMRDAARKLLAPVALTATVGIFALGGKGGEQQVNTNPVRHANTPADIETGATGFPLESVKHVEVTVGPGEGVDAQIKKVSPEAYAYSATERAELREAVETQDADGTLQPGQVVSVPSVAVPEIPQPAHLNEQPDHGPQTLPNDPNVHVQ